MKYVLFSMMTLLIATYLSARTHAITQWPRCNVIDEEKLLDCIAMVENSRNQTGKKGEIGTWQILPSTWQEHSDAKVSPNETVQRQVALNILRHYAVICAKKHNVVTAYNIALCWCTGPNAKKHGPMARNYASRVENLYHQ